MFDALERWMRTANESPLLENMSNEKVITFLTSPIGLGIAIGLIAAFILLKWRISAVAVTTVMAGIYIFQYTITETDAPNSTIYLFIAGAAALAGFIIYFTLMKEE